MKPLPSERWLRGCGVRPGEGQAHPQGPVLLEGRWEPGIPGGPEPQAAIPMPAGSKRWRPSWTHAGPGCVL